MRESLKRAKDKYRKNKVRVVTLHLLRKQEADVIDKLDNGPSKKQYIINLVRKDIENEKN